MDGRLEFRLDRAVREKYARSRALLRQHLNDAVERRGGGDVTPQQCRLMMILAEDGSGLAVGEIAKEMEEPYANVGRTLARLERKGWIRRTPDKRDRRCTMVYLTLEGTKVVRRLAAIVTTAQAELWSGLTESEKEQLLTLLTR
jgi:DNA-binding MarR family transcriptional regulator